MLKALNAHMQAGDLLVYAQHHEAYFREPPDFKDFAKDTPFYRLQTEILQGVLKPRGASLLMLGNYESLWAKQITDETKREKTLRKKATTVDAMKQIASRGDDHAYFMDLYPLFCDQKEPPQLTDPTDQKSSSFAPNAGVPTCTDKIPGTHVKARADAGHVSVVGSIYMWPHMCSAMEDMGLFLDPMSQSSKNYKTP